MSQDEESARTPLLSSNAIQSNNNQSDINDLSTSPIQPDNNQPDNNQPDTNRDLENNNREDPFPVLHALIKAAYVFMWLLGIFTMSSMVWLAWAIISDMKKA